MSANDELRAHLIVLYEHARDALKLLDDGAGLTAELTLPSGSAACAHPEKDRVRMMGGHWSCKCGAKGQDT
jgi:hypothetical protein